MFDDGRGNFKKYPYDIISRWPEDGKASRLKISKPNMLRLRVILGED